MHQDTANDVGRDIVPRMTQMTLVVDRRTARIPRHLALLDRHEWDGRARFERVVELEGLHGGAG